MLHMNSMPACSSGSSSQRGIIMKKLNLWIVMLTILVALVPLAVQAQDNRVTWTGSHTVQPGETLFRIALRYGVNVNTLASANGIFNPDRIYAGQVLVVPG